MNVRELVVKIVFGVDKKGAQEADKTVDKVKQKLNTVGDAGKKAGAAAASGLAEAGKSATKSAAEVEALARKMGAFQDKLGRWHSANGKYMSMGEKQSIGLAPGGPIHRQSPVRTPRMTVSSFLPAGLVSSLGRAGSIGAAGFRSMNSAALTTRAAVSGVTGAVGGLMGALGPLGAAIAAAFSVRAIKDTADEMMNLDGRIRNVTQSDEERMDVKQKLYELAQQDRQDLNAIGDLYFKVARGAKQFGVSQEESMRVTDIVSKALVTGGASATEAKASILQLGQALGSGRLQGDELRSLDENASNLMTHIAEHMGVTVGDLKQMGADGELTSQAVIEAILASGTAIDIEFSKMPTTIGQSMTLVGNVWKHFIDRVEDDKKVFSGIAGSIGSVAKGASKFVDDALDLLGGPKGDSDEAQAQYEALQAQHPVLTQILDIWNQLSAAASTFGNAISELGQVLAPLLSGIAPIIGVFIAMVVQGITFIISVFTAIINAVTWFADTFPTVTEAILLVGAAILAYIFAPFLLVIGLIGAIVYIVAEVADALAAAFDYAAEAASNFINSFMSGAAAAWSMFTGAASGAIDAVKEFFSGLYDYAVGIIKAIGSAISSWIGDKIEWAVGKLNDLKSFSGAVADGIADTVTNTKNSLTQTNYVTVPSGAAAGDYVAGAGGINFYDNG